MQRVVQEWRELDLPAEGPLTIVDTFRGTQRCIGVSPSDLVKNASFLKPILKAFPDRVPCGREVEALLLYIRPQANWVFLSTETALICAQLGYIRELARRTPKSRPHPNKHCQGCFESGGSCKLPFKICV